MISKALPSSAGLFTLHSQDCFTAAAQVDLAPAHRQIELFCM
ncbi:hypothetical protein SCH4B_0356 [Ruegeria sp. TrichCH4B]|nr:hypothetical protein SCH4B_0356 [Ruegeria sp. TrichCH4B]